MSLCLTAGAVSVSIAIQAFTLAWMHSIEKIRWEEDWRIENHTLRVVKARIQGTGAGMEPPPEATFGHGYWQYSPNVPPLKQVLLTHSPYTKGYELCLDSGCKPLADYLPGIENNTKIELSVCTP